MLDDKLQWINIKDKLPGKDIACLCYCEARPAMPYLVQKSWGEGKPNGFWDKYITHYIVLYKPGE